MAVVISSLLGSGPSFPYNRSNTGGLMYVEDLDRINQSLFIILSTPKGSRLMMPEFGSDIRKYRFDPLDQVLMEKLRYTITKDIDKWEPRISLTSIEFYADNTDIDNHTLYITITYKVIDTDVISNYVYPYKLETYDTEEMSN